MENKKCLQNSNGHCLLKDCGFTHGECDGDCPSVDKSEQIVDAIISDLTDRRGLRQEWEMIDEDIQEEIKETWISIVKGLTDESR